MTTTSDRTFQIQLPLTITGQDIEDILVTALEGWSNYWLKSVDPHPDSTRRQQPDEPTSRWVARCLLDGAWLFVRTRDEPDREHPFNVFDLVEGVKRWIELRAGQRKGLAWLLEDGTLNTGDIDAAEADVILQYAVLKEVVYG